MEALKWNKSRKQFSKTIAKTKLIMVIFKPPFGKF